MGRTLKISDEAYVEIERQLKLLSNDPQFTPALFVEYILETRARMLDAMAIEDINAHMGIKGKPND